jgi:hypothetical protein
LRLATPVPYEEGEHEALGTITAISVPGADEAYLVGRGVSLGMSVNDAYVAITFNGDYDGEPGGGTVAIATLVAANLN